MNDLNRIRDALLCIPASGHDVRFRVAAMLKSVLGEDGRSLRDEWRGDPGPLHTSIIMVAARATILRIKLSQACERAARQGIREVKIEDIVVAESPRTYGIGNGGQSALASETVSGRVMKVPSSGQALTMARIYLPYLLEPLGNGQYLPLNRYYKPLGLIRTLHARDWADYDDDKYSSLRLPAQLVDTAWLKEAGAGYFFFNDGNSPLSFWGSSTFERRLYLLKLWHTFRRTGFSKPYLQPREIKSAAKSLGVPVSSLLEVLQ